MSKKLIAAGVVLTLVAAVLVGVGASTASAQSMTLCQTVDALVLAGVIAPDKVAAAKAAAGCSAAVVSSGSFTRNLTVGSTGADVTALQTKLGVSPATGYFGAITKAAVVAYQAANGLPATGYVGPMTLAKLNAGAVVTPGTPATGCPAGMTCTPAVACPAGYTCTSNTGSVSTTGSEGSITVTQTSVGLPSSIYEGDSKVGVLAFKVEAKNSDVAVQRVAIDLGTSSRIYTKVLDKVYVMDGSTVLASSDLNADTVTKDSAAVPHYYITMTGMNLVVAKNTTKVITIAADVKSSVDSSYRNTNFAIALYKGAENTGSGAVRALDGAGLDQYDGTGYAGTTTAGTFKNLSVSSILADTATLNVSADSSTPDTAAIIASEGSGNNEVDGVTLLKLNLQGKKDAILVTDLNVGVYKTGSGAATLSTVYLYDGSTQLDSSSVSTGVASFSNLDINIAKDTTKTLTVKADVRSANTTAVSWTATTTDANITAENSLGTSIDATGSAIGKAQTFTSAGAEVTLLSKSVSASKGNVQTNTTSGASTSTQTYIFNVRVAAVGGPIVLGSSASTTNTGAAFGVATSTSVNVYKNTALQNALGTGVTLTVGYYKPSSGVTEDTNNSYTIAEGSYADFVVEYGLTVPTVSSGNYALGLKGVLVNGNTVNFMDGLDSWRSATVALP